MREHTKGVGFFVNLRAKTQEAGHPALEHPADTLGSVDVSYKMQDALLVRRGHDTSLDDIDGARCRGSSQASQERRSEVRGEGVAHRGVVQQQALEGVVRGELAGGHDGSTTTIGQPAAEPAQGALLPGHADHAVEGVLVVAALGRRQGGVVLHAHVDHVGKVAGNAADETRADGHGYQRGERRLFTAVPGDVALLDLLVDAEPGGRVRELAEQRRRDAAVEAERSIVFHDVDKGAAHGLGRIGLASLQADLVSRGLEEEEKKCCFT